MGAGVMDLLNFISSDRNHFMGFALVLYAVCHTLIEVAKGLGGRK